MKRTTGRLFERGSHSAEALVRDACGARSVRHYYNEYADIHVFIAMWIEGGKRRIDRLRIKFADDLMDATKYAADALSKVRLDKWKTV